MDSSPLCEFSIHLRYYFVYILFSPEQRDADDDEFKFHYDEISLSYSKCILIK